MKRNCPSCEGIGSHTMKDSTGLYKIPRTCDICRGKKDIFMLKETAAKRMFPGEFEGIRAHGWHSTSGVDQKSNLMIVIFPDKEFGNGKA